MKICFSVHWSIVQVSYVTFTLPPLVTHAEIRFIPYVYAHIDVWYYDNIHAAREL